MSSETEETRKADTLGPNTNQTWTKHQLPKLCPWNPGLCHHLQHDCDAKEGATNHLKELTSVTLLGDSTKGDPKSSKNGNVRNTCVDDRDTV